MRKAMLRRLRVSLDEEVDGVRASKVTDINTGEVIENIRSITITAGVGKVTTVTLELIAVEIEGVVNAETIADVTAIGDAYDRHRRV